MREIAVNLNDMVSFGLTKAGREQYVRSYNRDLPDMYHKKLEDVKSTVNQHLWEMFYFFGSSGFTKGVFEQVFEGYQFTLVQYSNGVCGDKVYTTLPCDVRVRVEWTLNGKKVMAAVEAEDVLEGFRAKEHDEYPDVMEIPLYKFAYLIQNECFNGNTRMPLTKDNAITFLVP